MVLLMVAFCSDFIYVDRKVLKNFTKVNNESKKLANHVVAHILQAQSIRDAWMSITAVSNRKPNKFFVKSS